MKLLRFIWMLGFTKTTESEVQALESEARALELELANDPTRRDLAARLAQVLSILGRKIPDELEFRNLCHASACKALADADLYNEAASMSAFDANTLACLFDEQPDHPWLNHLAYSRINKERAGIQSIAFFTLPKSGTVFLMNWLAAQSGLPLRAAGNSYFPEDDISLNRVMAVAAQPSVLFGHHHASARNLDILAWLTGRVTIQLRDPRSCLLSWLHHLSRIAKERPWSLHRVHPTPGPDFFAMNEAERSRWLAENFFPTLIQWIQGWVTAADRSDRPQIHLTTFEHFRRDPRVWMKETMSFHELPGEPVETKLLPKEANAHFREGSMSGWRTGLPEEVIRYCTAQIPSSIAERFGWTLQLG